MKLIKKLLLLCLSSFLIAVFMSSTNVLADTSASTDKTKAPVTTPSKNANSNNGGALDSTFEKTDLTAPIPSSSGTVTSVKSLKEYFYAYFNFGRDLAYGLSVIVLIFAGFKYVTAAGNEQAVTSAKELIVGVVVGLSLVLLTTTLFKYISDLL